MSNIQINITLDDRALDVLNRMLTMLEARPKSTDEANTQQVANVQPVANVPEVQTRSLAPETTSNDDMPNFDATSSPQKNYTDEELMTVIDNAVKSLRKAGCNPTGIKKQIYSCYGINRALDCPADKRAEFVAAVNTYVREKAYE